MSKHKNLCKGCKDKLIPIMAPDGTLRIVWVHQSTKELECSTEKAKS
ncbi:hypothetical protein GMA3_35 [Gordonia phage GMA3]|uniref:Uncharacterized protein n=1 Tax=Gordonia phage GMA3 TaxID=1647284 RepID=A0A0K0NKZ0_9CAUD|nr:hypothetical protein AU105_gp035 [Gordonia phage GMA3]AKL88212.1 hypothetical protein GMA3_35 [Gordonia phage GMA3]